MVDKAIDIKALNMEELIGVVNLYPWYAGSRMELCRRMAALGDGAWGEDRYAEMALYVSSRRMVGELMRRSRIESYADKDVDVLLKEYFSPQEEAVPADVVEPEEPAAVEPAAKEETAQEPKRQIFVVGGDYFSQNQYEKVRRADDNIFSSFAKGTGEAKAGEEENVDLSDFYTETLAQVYLEQGYPEQAKHIYSQLSLRYPEKSVYFAALIAKIDN